MKKGASQLKKKRNFEQTRAHILNVAFFEVYTRGFQGVSVDDIVRKTSLTKGAFYHHFPTKRDLGYALVDDVIKPMIIDRWIKPLERHKNPLRGILEQIQEHIGSCSAEDLKFGCPLNNLVQEMAPIDKGFKTRLEAALTLWIDQTEKHLIRAKDTGFLKKEINIQQVAQFIVMAHEGFYGIIKGVSAPGLFEALFASLKRYFDTITA